MKQFIVIALALLVSGCATYSKKIEQWNTLKESAEFKSEKATFYSRLGVEGICWETGVAQILRQGISPNRGCLYPASSMLVDEASLRSATQELKVIQTLPDSFRVYAETTGPYGIKRLSDRAAIILKTDEDSIVDGDYLDPNLDQWGSRLYLYVGPNTYETVRGGTITVHSFKKIPRAKLLKAMEGLKAYNFLDEAAGERGAWATMSGP